MISSRQPSSRSGCTRVRSSRSTTPRQPLDVLAQQIVAMVAVDDWAVADLLAVVRRSAPYEQLSEEVFTSVLDLLAGRYPSEEFRELRPRIVWDRTAGMLRARQGAGRLAVTNAGTIPDRGLYRRVHHRRLARRRARRGNGVRGARGGDVPAGSVDVEDRRDHPRARRGHARTRRAGQDAVLARRRGPADPLNSAAPSVHSFAPSPTSCLRTSRLS